MPISARTRKVLAINLEQEDAANELVNAIDVGGGSFAWGGITGTLTDQLDLVAALAAKQDTLPTYLNNALLRTDSSGVIASDTNWYMSADGALSVNKTFEPNNGGGYGWVQRNTYFEPLQNSPNESVTLYNNNAYLDNANSGFSQGTAGQSVGLESWYVQHQGTGEVGTINHHTLTYGLGTGTDAVTVRGMDYVRLQGVVNPLATINGPIQGVLFQPYLEVGSVTGASQYTTAFGDFATIKVASNSHTSFSASPQVTSIKNNSNYTGINLNPTIPTFTGNASFNGFAIAGTFGTFGTGSWQGINMSPSVTSVVNATGLYINMSSVTASGNKKAIDVVGDVNVQGALAFTGSLSIGQLNAFYAQNPVNGGGNPTTLHGLVTSMTAQNGVTVANADTIGVNTAMLITLEANSVTTSGALGLGFAPLALPCVVQTHTGATLDYMNAAVYALSLDGASTGGTIDHVNLCRAVAIPNGITTINELVGFMAEAPFGDVGTDSWGFYAASANANNYFANRVRIGVGSDKVSNNHALEVVGKVQLNGNIGFFGATEAAQQVGGVATAGGAYTATEQGMLQTVYNAMRTYGLLS